MTEQSFFWDADSISPVISATGAGDYGAYGQTSYEDWIRAVIGHANYSFDNQGVLYGNGDNLEVVPDSPISGDVIVKSGTAMVHGHPYINSADLPLTITPNLAGANTRYDLIVARATYTGADAVRNRVRLTIREGNAAVANFYPQPVQIAGTLFEIPLAYVTVPIGATTFDTIEDVRQWANTPQLVVRPAFNNSGRTLLSGEVVVWDTSGIDYVTTTTTAGNANVAGIWQGRIADQQWGFVVTGGVLDVSYSGAVTAGQFIETSTVSGQAINFNTGRTGVIFGRVLETIAGAGKARTWINFGLKGHYQQVEVMANFNAWAFSSAENPVVFNNYRGDAIDGNGSTFFYPAYSRLVVPLNAFFTNIIAARVIPTVVTSVSFTVDANASYAQPGQASNANTGSLTTAAILAAQQGQIVDLPLTSMFGSLNVNQTIGVNIKINATSVASDQLLPLTFYARFLCYEP